MSFTRMNITRNAFFPRLENRIGNPFFPFFLPVLIIGREEKREGGREEGQKQ